MEAKTPQRPREPSLAPSSLDSTNPSGWDCRGLEGLRIADAVHQNRGIQDWDFSEQAPEPVGKYVCHDGQAAVGPMNLSHYAIAQCNGVIDTPTGYAPGMACGYMHADGTHEPQMHSRPLLPHEVDLVAHHWNQMDPELKQIIDHWDNEGPMRYATLGGDPLACGICGSYAMSEPRQIGNKWYSTCTQCHRTHIMPPTHPVVKMYQQPFTPYPQMLQDLNQDRPMSIYAFKQSGGDDNYEDTRQFADELVSPVDSAPVAPALRNGCTCMEGWKLECPIHGLHGDDSKDIGWSIPEGSPIGWAQSDMPGKRTHTESKARYSYQEDDQGHLVPILIEDSSYDDSNSVTKHSSEECINDHEKWPEVENAYYSSHSDNDINEEQEDENCEYHSLSKGWGFGGFAQPSPQEENQPSVSTGSGKNQGCWNQAVAYYSSHGDNDSQEQVDYHEEEKHRVKHLTPFTGTEEHPQVHQDTEEYDVKSIESHSHLWLWNGNGDSSIAESQGSVKVADKIVDPRSLPIHDPTLLHALQGSRFKFNHIGSKRDWGNTERHEYEIEPVAAPATHVFTDDWGRTKKYGYDPELTKPDDMPTPMDNGHRFRSNFDLYPHPEWKDEMNFRDDVQAHPDMIYRGMSHEEWEQAQKDGYVQSNRSYNLGENGTLFSTNPDQARSYATGFAPWHLRPGFDKPSYVIGVPRPQDAYPHPNMGADTTEVVAPNAVPLTNAQAWQFRPYVTQYGDMAIGSENGGQSYGRMGGGIGFSQNAYRRLPASNDLPATNISPYSYTRATSHKLPQIVGGIPEHITPQGAAPWSPGKPGKAIYNPNGPRLYTWSDGMADPEMHHYDVHINEPGLPWDGWDSGNSADGSNRGNCHHYNISPQGQMIQWRGEQYDEVNKHFPGVLQPPPPPLNERWKFTKVAEWDFDSPEDKTHKWVWDSTTGRGAIGTDTYHSRLEREHNIYPDYLGVMAPDGKVEKYTWPGRGNYMQPMAPGYAREDSPPAPDLTASQDHPQALHEWLKQTNPNAYPADDYTEGWKVAKHHPIYHPNSSNYLSSLGNGPINQPINLSQPPSQRSSQGRVVPVHVPVHETSHQPLSNIRPHAESPTGEMSHKPPITHKVTHSTNVECGHDMESEKPETVPDVVEHDTCWNLPLDWGITASRSGITALTPVSPGQDCDTAAQSPQSPQCAEQELAQYVSALSAHRVPAQSAHNRPSLKEFLGRLGIREPIEIPENGFHSELNYTLTKRSDTNSQLWVDDERPPPGMDWDWARNVPQARLMLRKTPYAHASLDHDLGTYLLPGGGQGFDPKAEDGVALADWMVSQGRVPPSIHIHSANPYGATSMYNRLAPHATVTMASAEPYGGMPTHHDPASQAAWKLGTPTSAQESEVLFENSGWLAKASSININQSQNDHKEGNPLNVQWHGEPRYLADHSMLYEPDTDTLHIGEPNLHHADLRHVVPGHTVPMAVYDGKFESYSPSEHDQRVYDHINNLHEQSGGFPLYYPGQQWEFGSHVESRFGSSKIADMRGEWAGADLYHVAPTTERRRIMQHGLQPANPAYNQRWDGEAEGVPVDPDYGPLPFLHNQPTGVYAMDNPNDALHAWGDSDVHPGSHQWDVWRIPGEQIQHTLKDNVADHALVIPHTVYPTLHSGPEHRWDFSNPAQQRDDWDDWALDWDLDYQRAQMADNSKLWGIGLPDRVIGRVAADNQTWTPGSYGKGLIDMYGQVHHWNTNASDEAWEGSPHHSDYEISHPGILGRTYYYIEPDGEVSKVGFSRLPEDLTRFTNSHPDFYNNNPATWNFGKVSMEPTLDWQTTQYPETTIHQTDQQGMAGADDQTNEPDFQHRRPIIYDYSTGDTYIGGPGHYHDDIYGEYPNLFKTYAQHVHGTYSAPNTFGSTDAYLGWFNHPPPDKTRARIHEHLGAPPVSRGWSFAKVATNVYHGTIDGDSSHFEYENDGSGGATDHTNSRPVIHDTANDNLYIGQLGTHHADLIDEFNLHHDGDTFDPCDWCSDAVEAPNLNYGIIEPRYNPRTRSYDGSTTFNDMVGDISGHEGARQALQQEGVLFRNPGPGEEFVPGTKQWNFAKVGMTTEQSDTTGDAGDWDYDFEKRRPIIYDPARDHLHIGGLGQYHTDVYQEQGIDINNPDGLYEGMHFAPQYDNNYISWYGSAPHRDIDRKIHQHFGLPYMEAPSQPGWSFSKVAGEDGYGDSLGWTPGSYGKGLVTAQGDVHHWNINATPKAIQHFKENAGKYIDDNMSDLEASAYVGGPHHDDYVNDNGIDWVDMNSAYWMDPQGHVTEALQGAEPEDTKAFMASHPMFKPQPQMWNFSARQANGQSISPWKFSARTGNNQMLDLGEMAQPWQYGKDGKGLFLQDGSMAHWQTDPWGGPHHSDVWQHLTDTGQNPDRNYISHYMHIEPDGTTVGLPFNLGPEHWAALAPHGLHPAEENNWNFDDEDPMAASEDWWKASTHIQYHETPWASGDKSEVPDSRAMIYDDGTDTLHVGQTDDVYHREMWPHIQGEGYPGYMDKGGYQWYQKPPTEDPTNAIQQHFGPLKDWDESPKPHWNWADRQSHSKPLSDATLRDTLPQPSEPVRMAPVASESPAELQTEPVHEDNKQLAEMQAKLDLLMAKIEQPVQVEEKKPRKLIINRDSQGKMSSIEELV